MIRKSDKAVFAAVLAAGSASRFGATKQLAIYRGAPLAGRAVAVASTVFGARTALVVGHDWRAVYAACMPFDGFVIMNERHADGIGTSIACAARSLGHAADAIVIMLADQPLVTAGHLRDLRDTFTGAGDEIVASEFAGTLGPPCLFARGAFADLAKLDGDSGGRELLADARFRVSAVPFAPAAVDIDRPADLEGL